MSSVKQMCMTSQYGNNVNSDLVCLSQTTLVCSNVVETMFRTGCYTKRWAQAQYLQILLLVDVIYQFWIISNDIPSLYKHLSVLIKQVCGIVTIGDSSLFPLKLPSGVQNKNLVKLILDDYDRMYSV